MYSYWDSGKAHLVLGGDPCSPLGSPTGCVCFNGCYPQPSPSLLPSTSPARYVHDNYGAWAHYALEVLFYGTTGPIVMWIILRIVRTWVEQKEQAEAEVYRLNTELQQRVDERTRELREKNEALAAANEQLQELDRLKSEFVSLVSHELRAPLTNVRGAVELMESGCPTLNPTCARMFKIVSEQIGRLGRMVDEVLDVSRIEAGGLTLAREAVDVMWVTDRVVDEFTARHVRRRFRRPSGVEHLQLWADTDRLHEVVANLMDNAVKYSPEDGEVAIRVDIREKKASSRSVMTALAFRSKSKIASLRSFIASTPATRRKPTAMASACISAAI